jgi:hypothetical protein
MGAPGEAWFCRRGHLYQWIDDDLCWDEAEEATSRRASQGCSCGERVVTSVFHYGDVNDCRDFDRKLHRLGAWRHSRTVRVKGAHDGQGRPVVAYVDRVFTLDRYDVSGLDFPAR